MKAKLLLFLLTVISFTMVSAQVRVQQDANTVTFVFLDTIDGDVWDANGNPVYIYLFIDTEDTTNGISTEPLGSWPGTQMIDLGDDAYKVSTILSDFYPNGTTISEIYYTLNDNMGNQNPLTGGFSAVEASYVPITTLSTIDIEENNTTFNIINGQLVVSQNETVSVQVYNITGQLVKSIAPINLNADNRLDLNLSENQLYLVKIESQKGVKVIKTVR